MTTREGLGMLFELLAELPGTSGKFCVVWRERREGVTSWLVDAGSAPVRISPSQLTSTADVHRIAEAMSARAQTPGRQRVPAAAAAE